MATFSGSPGDDLRSGSAEADLFQGHDGNDRLGGRGGDDVLDGGEGDDLLVGGAGDDLLVGGRGRNRIDGGTGVDTVSYAGAGSRVIVDLGLAAPQNTRGAGIDWITFCENLLGSRFNDALAGDGNANRLWGQAGNDLLEGRDGNDRLSGGQGRDVLRGGLGNDRLDGGSQFDVASYVDLASGVRVDLALAGPQDTLGGGIDTLVAIEGLTGTNLADTLSGNALANAIAGQAGDDVLVGRAGNDALDGGLGDDTIEGGEGDDRIEGGAGTDTAVWQGDLRDVAVASEGDLLVVVDAEGTDRVGGVEFFRFGDALFERVEMTALALAPGAFLGADTFDQWQGTTEADTGFGMGGNDVLDGGDGDDTLFGREGLDVLLGGAGDDHLHGGEEWDTASWEGAASGVTVDLGLQGVAQDTQGGGIDTLWGIEALAGSGHDDVLRMGAAGGGLSGGAGDDVLVAGAGIDLLGGGQGADRYVWERLEDAALDARGDADVIEDWTQGDRIDLAGLGLDAAQIVITHIDSANPRFGFTAALIALDGEGGGSLRIDVVLEPGGRITLGDLLL